MNEDATVQGRVHWSSKLTMAAVLALCLTFWGVASLAGASDDLGEEQYAFLAGSSDPTPSGLSLEQLGVGGITPDSVYYLGKHDSHLLYFGRDDFRNVCLIAYQPLSQSSASSCGSPSGLESAPLSVGLWSAEAGGVEAHLLQNDMSIMSLPPGWSQVSPNLVAVSIDENSQGEAVVQLANGEVISLRPQGHPEALDGLPARYGR